MRFELSKASTSLRSPLKGKSSNESSSEFEKIEDADLKRKSNFNSMKSNNLENLTTDRERNKHQKDDMSGGKTLAKSSPLA